MPNAGSDNCGTCWFNTKNKGETGLGHFRTVFMATRQGSRRIWQPSPDTEEVRLHLLELSTQIPEVPTDEYPAGPLSDEMVVWQLGELREKLSVEQLRRVAGFSPRREEPLGT
jgi:hypothetical protein